jgi:hypothetical protein
VKSPIKTGEGFVFFYKNVPYQGLLDSSTFGTIEAEGPAITTSSGSALITDVVEGIDPASATFTAGSSVVRGSPVISAANWTATIKPGYTISNQSLGRQFVITSVIDSTTVAISEAVPAGFAITGGINVIADDQPFFNQSNVIDRLPVLSASEDSNGNSDLIITALTDGYPVIETRIISRVQDILDQIEENVNIGVNGADRGRSAIHIKDAPLGLGNLGLKFESLTAAVAFQKTYQAYVLNKENKGELYLMVVGSESGNTSTSRFLDEKTDSDTVDIFRMPGRPLVRRKFVH